MPSSALECRELPGSSCRAPESSPIRPAVCEGDEDAAPPRPPKPPEALADPDSPAKERTTLGIIDKCFSIIIRFGKLRKSKGDGVVVASGSSGDSVVAEIFQSVSNYKSAIWHENSSHTAKRRVRIDPYNVTSPMYSVN